MPKMFQTKMDKNARLQLKHEIQVFITKNPNAKTLEVNSISLVDMQIISFSMSLDGG